MVVPEDVIYTMVIDDKEFPEICIDHNVPMTEFPNNLYRCDSDCWWRKSGDVFRYFNAII